MCGGIGGGVDFAAAGSSGVTVSGGALPAGAAGNTKLASKGRSDFFCKRHIKHPLDGGLVKVS